MAKATRLPASSERGKRRLHLREIKNDPHAQLDSVGATLRAARLNRGDDPDQVAAALRMKREHIEAIEDNDFTRLPGRTYAIGFVRAYARYLGLDAEVMVQRFKEESAGREHDKTVALVFPDAPEEKRAASGSLLLVAVLIAGAIAGAYYMSIPKKHVTTTVAATAEEPAAVVVNDPAASAPVGPAAQSASSNLVQPSSLLGQAQVPSAAVAAPQIPAVASATPAAASTTPAQPDGKVYGEENANARVVFRANAETYILVKALGPDGKVTLIDRTLKAGESYRAPDKTGVTLVTGNAGGLDVEVDNKKLGTLGKAGEMLRNVPVDPNFFVEHVPAGDVASATPAKPKVAAAPKPVAATPPASTASTPAASSVAPTSTPAPAQAPLPATPQ